MSNERFKKAVEIAEDQYPDDLLDEDWNTLARVLLAYVWNDKFKEQLKAIEADFLLEEQSERQEMIEHLRKGNTNL